MSRKVAIALCENFMDGLSFRHPVTRCSALVQRRMIATWRYKTYPSPSNSPGCARTHRKIQFCIHTVSRIRLRCVFPAVKVSRPSRLFRHCERDVQGCAGRERSAKQSFRLINNWLEFASSLRSPQRRADRILRKVRSSKPCTLH